MDHQIVARFLECYERLKSQGKHIDEDLLASFYETFKSRFAPDILSSLQGEELANAMHNLGDRNSLAYWLEFKSDDEFDTTRLGSIRGGSALKFDIYKGKKHTSWMGRGEGSNPVEITLDEAVEVAERNRVQLLKGCELLETMPAVGSTEDYARLQRGMDEQAPNVSRLAWGHKYFSLLYPNLLDDYHNPTYQKYHLVKLGQVPPDTEGRYLAGEHFLMFARELGIPVANLTLTLNDLHGKPHRYWRIEANYPQDGENWMNWGEMRDAGFIGIGWGNLGDLSHISHDQAGKKELRATMKEKYQDQGRWVSEIFNFVVGIETGDVVLATEHEKVLGCGVVEGGYYFDDPNVPHRRGVTWVSGDAWSFPAQEEEGRAVGEVKNGENLVAIEEKLREGSDTGPRSPSKAEGVNEKLEAPAVLNRILSGVPGSGKTYSVQRRAVEIIDLDVSDGDVPDAEVAARFREYALRGRIEFVTFHQSYSYEEFVEGFRYDPETQVPTLHKGVFQTFADNAANPKQEQASSEGAKVWKISLGTSEQQHIFERCMKNNEVSIGWLEGENLLELWDDEPKLFEDELKLLFKKRYPGSSPKSVVNFVSGMQIGDYVAVRGSQRTIRAIGMITGEYEFKERYGEQPHVRSVEWLDLKEHDIFRMNGNKILVQQTVYELKEVSLQDFVGLLPSSRRDGDKPYVLIIDEINRGNISRIFGELITLLEPDKRRGAANELSLRLPYSGKRFSVPGNLHVIGTMNSTDRSIALIDTALRRRFEFEEMKPDSKVIRRVLSEKVGSLPDGLSVEQIDLVCTVFDRLNARIRALLDRDHQIGHGYLLDATTPKRLHEVFYEKILPLLQEYFYNDPERLGRLVGGYTTESSGGFVEIIKEEYGTGFQHEEEDETTWEFHVYGVEDLAEALRRTFG